MAYKPTIADINEIDNEGYKPTLNDINEIDAQKSSISQNIAQKPSFNPFEEMTVNPTLGALQTVINAIPGAYNLATSGINRLLGTKIPQSPEANFAPNTIGSQIGQLGGMFLGPGALGAISKIGGIERAASSIPMIANSLNKARDILALKTTQATLGAGMGAGMFPEHPVLGAIGGAAAGPVLRGTTTAISTAREMGKDLFRNPDKLANQLYENISGGLKSGKLNKLNAENINQNYQNKLNQGKQLFNNFLNEAHATGYSPDITVGIPGISQTTNFKRIDLDPITNNNLDRLLMANKDKELSGITSDLNNLIDNFKKSPSVDNAHRLQSELLKERSNLISSKEINPSERNTANLLHDTRIGILDSISNSFIKNGDIRLNNSFENARNFWRIHIVPYNEIPEVARIVQGKQGKAIPNILKALEKYDIPGTRDIIRTHLQENPSQIKDLLALTLSKGLKAKEGELKPTAENVLNAYASAPEAIKDITDPISANYLANLEKSYRTHQKLKKLAKYGMGAGALYGGAEAINEIRNLLNR